MQEIWKDIDGYEGLYQVSNLGKIMSLNYMHTKQSQILKIKKTYDGYHRVNLCKDGKVTTCSVHILVAKAFIPNINSKPQVNHKDGNKDNNRVDNLEWVTGKENVIHSIKMGLRKPENRTYLKGQDHYLSKPVFQYDLSGNLIKEWGCQSDAARFYGFRVGSINSAIHGRIKTYKGFIWRSEPL